MGESSSNHHHGHGSSGNTSRVLPERRLRFGASLRVVCRRRGVTLTGTHFLDGATVTFAGVPGTGVSVVDETELTVVAPALPAATVNDIQVTNTDATAGVLKKAWIVNFLDVPGGQQFFSFVTTLVSNAITAGISGGLYGVDQPTLRQQMAVFLLKGRHGICYVPPPCVGVFPTLRARPEPASPTGSRRFTRKRSPVAAGTRRTVRRAPCAGTRWQCSS